MRALAAEEAGEPWGLTRTRACARDRLCINPEHWALSDSTGNDWSAQKRADSGQEAVVAASSPAEVAYKLTRDASLDLFVGTLERSLKAHKDDMVQLFAHHSAILAEVRANLSEVQAIQDRTLAAHTGQLRELRQKVTTLAILANDAEKSDQADRFPLATGDANTLHPPVRSEPASGAEGPLSADEHGEGVDEVVQDMPVVVAPEGPMLFEATALGSASTLTTSLEELDAVGECARVWVVCRKDATWTLADLQAVADSWATMLRGTLYDRDAFVYGLCLVLEAAAMDAACDGTLQWVRDNVGRYVNDVCQRLRVAVGRGLDVSKAPVS